MEKNKLKANFFSPEDIIEKKSFTREYIFKIQYAWSLRSEGLVQAGDYKIRGTFRSL